jgi:selenophosphate synthetase-related protein
MAGCLGTALMLLECSQVGAVIELDRLPHPPGQGPDDGDAAWLRWLSAFPSYGYLLSVEADQVDAVCTRFAARDLACAVIGEVTAERQVWLRQRSACAAAPASSALLWDFTQKPFIGGRERVPAPVDAGSLA